MRMLADHARIRAAFQALTAALAGRRAVDSEVAELGRLLNDHVRLEEEQVFPRIEAALEEEELAALGRGLTRLHPGKKA